MGHNALRITRREFGIAAGALATTAFAAETTATPPVLDIAEWSFEFIGVEHALLARGTVCNGMQMFVERWIPTSVRHPYPVVLIHGGYGQGSDWYSTPDGNRGWASLFLEQGYKVYVIDRPGQGRNPYQPFVHGQFDREAQTFEKTAAALGKSATDPEVTSRSRPRWASPWPTAPPHKPYGERAAQCFSIKSAPPSSSRKATEPSSPQSPRSNARTWSKPSSRLNQPDVSPTKPRRFPSKNSTSSQPVLDWLSPTFPQPAPAIIAERNTESTALKLADQGGFWIGAQRKSMPYGTIPMGQMFVQYMIPAEKKHPYPVVMVHGGGGQGTHMMGIGGRPGFVHYFVQNGYSVYWLDRPSYGRSPYHPDALGPSHLPNVPALEGLIGSTTVFNTAQWPGPGGMNDPLIDQFMACESGNTADEAFHSDLVWRGGAELLDKIGPSILFVHAFGGFAAWGMADRRPNLVKAIMAMEINGNPFAAQLRWGLTAGPMTFDPPVTDLAQFKLIDKTEPPDSPRPVVASYKLQADPVHKWKNLQNIPIGWITSEFGGGGSPISNVDFLKQVGCNAEMIRLRDYGIIGNGNLMLMEKNNHEVFAVIRDWLDKKVKA